MHLKKPASVMALALAIGLALGACGSDDEEPSTTAGGTHQVDGLTFPTPEKTKLEYGLGGRGTVGYLPMLYAADQKIFEKYGLDVEFRAFGSGSQEAQAMLAGQIDMQDQAGAPILATVNTKDPQQLVYVSRSNLTDILFAGEDVQSADDLKGKAIAVSSLGGQSYAGAVIALESLGLTPDDVTITPVGDDSARLAALRGGSVGASIQDSAQAPTLEPLGIHPLVSLADVEGKGVVRTGAATTVDFAEKYPSTVLALVAAYMEAQATMADDPERLSELFAKDSGLPLDEATEAVKISLAEPWLPIGGTCPDQELAEFQKTVFMVADPSLEDVDPMKACTNKFIDQLRDIGLQKKLGIE